jgi:hypothetical protein
MSQKRRGDKVQQRTLSMFSTPLNWRICILIVHCRFMTRYFVTLQTCVCTSSRGCRTPIGPRSGVNSLLHVRRSSQGRYQHRYSEESRVREIQAVLLLRCMQSISSKQDSIDSSTHQDKFPQSSIRIQTPLHDSVCTLKWTFG